MTPTKSSATRPHALAFFRAALGAIIFLLWLEVLLDAPSLNAVDWLLFGGMLIMSAMLTIGAFMKPVAIVIAGIYALEGTILTAANIPASMNITAEQALLFTLMLIITAFSGADRAASHAMLLRYGSAWEWEDVKPWPQKLLKLLITAAYIFIGYYVLWKPVWMSGVRVRSALIGSLGTGLAAKLGRSLMPTSAFSGVVYAIKAFSMMLPICIWIKAVRKGFLILGLIFHLIVGVLTGNWWLFVLAAGYPLFLDPKGSEAFFKKYWSQLISCSKEAATS